MIEVLLFLVGIHFMMMLLAAIYRLVDLWYCIGKYWMGIVFRLALIAALNYALLTFLSQDNREAFLWGQGSYLVFHIVIFWLAQIGFKIMELVKR